MNTQEELPKDSYMCLGVSKNDHGCYLSQGMEFELHFYKVQLPRNVYIRSPQEPQSRGTLWRLKFVYGLADASLYWYNSERHNAAVGSYCVTSWSSCVLLAGWLMWWESLLVRWMTSFWVVQKRCPQHSYLTWKLLFKLDMKNTTASATCEWRFTLWRMRYRCNKVCT